jgi:tRNA pseudouridine55 synthase
VELKPSFVSIHEMEVKKIEDNTFDLHVHCSKGTYIRSLAFDLGEVMGTGAHLSGLRRTEIGPFTVDDAMSMEEFEKMMR